MTRRTRGELTDAEYRMARWEAEHATCPRCNATGRQDTPDGTAESCRNPITGDELRAPAHWQRIDASKENPTP